MLFFRTCIWLAVYLIFIFLSTMIAVRFYHRVYYKALSLNIPIYIRTILASISATIPLCVVFILTLGFSFIVFSNPIAGLGLSYAGDSLLYTCAGAVMGFLCVALVVLFGYLVGFIRIKRPNTRKPSMRTALLYMGLIDFIVGAVLEEIVARGFVFYLLYRAFGGFTAVAGSSLIFAVSHLADKKRQPPVFIINAFIFGLLTAMCRLCTGSLWLSIGLHLGWNITSCPILGLPCSGRAYDRGVVSSEVSGPVWFTGGTYSPDAGVLGTFALIMAAFGLHLVMPFI